MYFCCVVVFVDWELNCWYYFGLVYDVIKGMKFYDMCYVLWVMNDSMRLRMEFFCFLLFFFMELIYVLDRGWLCYWIFMVMISGIKKLLFVVILFDFDNE